MSKQMAVHKKAEQEQKLEGKNLAFGRKQKNRSRRCPNWPHLSG